MWSRAMYKRLLRIVRGQLIEEDSAESEEGTVIVDRLRELSGDITSKKSPVPEGSPSNTKAG